MYKGRFYTETYSPEKTIIHMKNWVEPTMHNVGDTTAYLNGIAIAPGDTFILGPAHVEMSGTLEVQFLKSSLRQEVKINYVLLVKETPEEELS